MDAVQLKMQMFIEDAWDDLRPELNGLEITKHDMITMACKNEIDSIVDTLTMDDRERAVENLKEEVFYWWQLHLEDFEEDFEAMVEAEKKEAREDAEIDAFIYSRESF